jgi:hypothetical protein
MKNVRICRDLLAIRSNFALSVVRKANGGESVDYLCIVFLFVCSIRNSYLATWREYLR